jgi:riboflavin kinase/FMN adenylyltransferase
VTPPALRITVLGSGTSVGVPSVLCDCEVCTSTDPRDQRLRPSVYLSYNGRGVLIDTTPDFRTQALRFRIPRVDAVLYTHSHADHIMGLDDLRPYNFRQRQQIPIFGSAETLTHIQRAFWYVFDAAPQESAIPKLKVHEINGRPFELFGMTITPVPLLHGKQQIYGFRFGRAAYLTDHSDIPAGSLPLLEDLEVLFLDALRYKPHPTHTSIGRALEWVQRLRPRRAFFTHMCHDVSHARAEAGFPDHVRLAYDGLIVDVAPAEARVFRSLGEIAAPPPAAVAIGNFDGVHLGHRELLRRAVAHGRAGGLAPTVLTFDPHPAKVVAPTRAPKLLTTLEQRLEILADLGIERVLVLPFTPEVAHWTPRDFVDHVLAAKLNAKVVVVGEDFRFGHRAAGDAALLRELGAHYGFTVDAVAPVGWRRMPVSSTEIRRRILAGDVGRAARKLARPHWVDGTVVAGHGIGAKQTVPTLNLATDSEVLPATGVYITRAADPDSHRRWPAVTNVGYRPTFGGESLSIETFLLAGLDGEPPRRLRVEFLRRLRAERRFESPEALKAQILKDVGRAQAFWRRVARWVRQVY